MWALVWFFTGMLAKMYLHIATLRENSSTPIIEALEGPFVSICFVVLGPDGLAHLLGDGLKPFLAS